MNITVPRNWALGAIAAPAAVSIWGGWVGLGGMCGFGPIHLLPGIANSFVVNTAITLPIGVEAYGTYALGVWLAPGTPQPARVFAQWSAIGALVLGMTGQVIYHLLAAAHRVHAPAPVTVFVACLPVVALFFGAALAHLRRSGTGEEEMAAETPGTDTASVVPEPEVPSASLPDTDTAVPGTAESDTGTAEPVPPVPDELPVPPDGTDPVPDTRDTRAVPEDYLQRGRDAVSEAGHPLTTKEMRLALSCSPRRACDVVAALRAGEMPEAVNS